MPWAKFSDGFDDDPELHMMGPEAGILFVCAVTWCSRNLTDGYIPDVSLRRLVGYSAEAVERLTTAQMPGSESWLTREGQGYRVRSYLEYNPSKEEVIAMREARAEAGRRGGILSGESRREAKAQANAKQTLEQMPSKPEANREAKGEAKSNPIPIPIPVPGKGNTQALLGRQRGMQGGEETGEAPQPTEPPQPPPKGKGRVLSGNRPESMPEAKDYGAEIGLPNPQVERFCDFWDSRGWKGRTGAIVDWKAAMRTWKSKWLEEEATKAAKPKPKVKETVEQTYQRVQLELRSAGVRA